MQNESEIDSFQENIESYKFMKIFDKPNSLSLFYRSFLNDPAKSNNIHIL